MQNATIHTNDKALLRYNPVNKTFEVSTPMGFPRTIDLVSHKTGFVMSFVQDTEAAVEAEWWDGEMMMYKSLDEEYKIAAFPY